MNALAYAQQYNLKGAFADPSNTAIHEGHQFAQTPFAHIQRRPDFGNRHVGENQTHLAQRVLGRGYIGGGFDAVPNSGMSPAYLGKEMRT